MSEDAADMRGKGVSTDPRIMAAVDVCMLAMNLSPVEREAGLNMPK